MLRNREWKRLLLRMVKKKDSILEYKKEKKHVYLKLGDENCVLSS